MHLFTFKYKNILLNMNTYIDKTSIINGKSLLVSSENSIIRIGKYCAIGENLTIMTLNHDYNYPVLQGTFFKTFFNEPPFYGQHPGELNNPPTKERTKGDVIIGNDIWIGMNVYISSGVTIGDGCCIGANSVITKDLPPYTICVGTPCRPIKYRYSQEVINFLMNLKWWNWSDEKIKKNKEFFYLNLNTIENISEIEIK